MRFDSPDLHVQIAINISRALNALMDQTARASVKAVT
jgi:hypothetical protein